MMFAPGALMVGRLARRQGWGWVRPVALLALLGSGLILAPLAKPILPVEQYVAYAERIGQEPSTGERKELGRLPQFFADRLGWPELAGTVARVYDALPPEEREHACIFGQNYGQAGAIDFYGKELGLPGALSAHNSYHLWGPRDCTAELMIVLGDRRECLQQIFESVERGALFTCDDCMPYEDDKPIWVCRNMRFPLDQLWAEIKHYD